MRQPYCAKISATPKILVASSPVGTRNRNSTIPLRGFTKALLRRARFLLVHRQVMKNMGEDTAKIVAAKPANCKSMNPTQLCNTRAASTRCLRNTSRAIRRTWWSNTAAFLKNCS